MLVELSAQQVVVGGFPGKPVAVLFQHHRGTSSGYQVPHALHARPLQGCPTLAGVLYLLEILVALTGGVSGSFLCPEYSGSPAPMPEASWGYPTRVEQGL